MVFDHDFGPKIAGQFEVDYEAHLYVARRIDRDWVAARDHGSRSRQDLCKGAWLFEAAEIVNFNEIEREGGRFDGQAREAVMEIEGFRRLRDGVDDYETRGHLA